VRRLAAHAGVRARAREREGEREREEEGEGEGEGEGEREREREREREGERESTGGLTREVETPLPSNSPHDHMLLRERALVGSHGRWKRPCLQTAMCT
jgi:hypothetical protein